MQLSRLLAISLIEVKTIGYGSEARNQQKVHGAPLEPEEARLLVGWDYAPFEIQEVYADYRQM